MTPKATRALSLVQPWAWALFHAGKTIENRAWRSCNVRGPVWIHASAGVVYRDFDAAVDSVIAASRAARGGRSLEDFLPHDQIELRTRFTGRPRPSHVVQQYRPGPAMALGAIVGRIDIVGIVANVGPVGEGGNVVMIDGEPRRELTADERLWWIGGFGLVVRNPVSLPLYVPCKGMLGFWTVPDHVLRICEKQLP